MEEKYNRFLGNRKKEKCGIAHGGGLFFGTAVVLVIFIVFIWALVDDYLAALWDIDREIALYYWLFGALFLFCTGLFGAVVFKNMLKILVSVEVMLFSAALNFIIFALFVQDKAVFGFCAAGVVLAAGLIGAVFGCYFLKNVCKYKKSLHVDRISVIKS